MFTLAGYQNNKVPTGHVKKVDKNSKISGSANWSQFHPWLAVCGVRKHRRLVTPLENWGWQKCGGAYWRTPGLRILSAVFSFISFCSRALSQMYNSTHGTAWWQGKSNYYLNQSLHTKVTRRSHAIIVGIMHWNIWWKEELHCSMVDARFENVCNAPSATIQSKGLFSLEERAGSQLHQPMPTQA